MIVLDTSAVIAIVTREHGYEALRAIVAANSPACALSALNYFEAGMVLFSRNGVGGLQDLEEFLTITGTALIPFDASQAEEALRAFRRYGKGIDPKARLNICDCAAYALAKSRNASLLFKGDDFTATDISPAASP